MAKQRGSSSNGTPPTFDARTYQRIFGATFADASHRALITIGTRTWTKWQLGRLGCPHPAAAAAVQRALDTMRITTPAQLIERAPEFGKYARLGVTAYAVVMALVLDCGGDVEQAHGDEASFHAIHARALRAMQPTPEDEQRTSPREGVSRKKTRRRTV